MSNETGLRSGLRIFAITSKILRILMGHIQPKDRSDSKLQIEYISSVETRDILKVIVKTSFSKNAK